MSEREAIERMKRGEIDALAVLVRAYQVKAVRTAYLIIGERALAEDVVQAAFLRCYRKIYQFDSNRRFEPWFMRSVVNAAVDAAKRHQRDLSLDAPVPGAEDNLAFADLLTTDTQSPESALEASEQSRIIRAALDDLSTEQRAAIVQRYYLDMSEKEMSQATDTAPGTVKWRLHAARQRLKALLMGRVS